MIENVEYKDWSLEFHQNHAKDPIVMQIELTYRCPLHCVHCYADCYNNAEYTKNELSTENIKKIMNKLHAAGSVWLTFTGGDPMTREDFLELYDYAKSKGFIFSIMTSLVSLTDKILKKMIENPPFSIEMTLNGVTEETYERISQVKGSFKKVITNIDKVLEAGLPLKIKTLSSKENIHEINKIKDYVESKGLTFSPSNHIFARLNGDTTPCKYRLPAEDIIKDNFFKGECETVSQANQFFRCATGNWQWHINPLGKLNICSCVREPSCDILNNDVDKAVRNLSEYVQNKRFSENSECKTCNIWHICSSCPGKAKLEVGNEQAPVPYFCELAKMRAKKAKVLQI